MRTNETVEPFLLSRCYRNRASTVLDWTIVSLLGLLVLLAPLPFGSVEQPFIFMVQIMAAGCFFLWITRLFLFGNRQELASFRDQHRQHRDLLRKGPFFHRRPRFAQALRFATFGVWPKKNPAFAIIEEETPTYPFPYYAFCGYPVKNTGVEKIVLAFLLLLLFQMVPFPSFVADALSRDEQNLYQSVSKTLQIPLPFHPLSFNSYATFSKLMLYASYFMIYLTVINVVRNRSFYLFLIYAIVVSAVFQSSYGLYEQLSGHHQIFWYKKKYFLDSASGTFINRNHFAVYLGLSIPLLMGLMAGRFTHYKSRTEKLIMRFLRIIDPENNHILLQFHLLLAIALGIIFSLSITGGAPVVLACVAFFYLYSGITKSRKVYGGLAVLFIVLSLVTYFGSDTVEEKLRGIPAEVLSDRSRFQAWNDTFTIFLTFPFTGTGAGTFPDIFPVYRTFGTDTLYSQAHNEYLQHLSENGIFMLLFFSYLFYVIVRQLNRLRESPVSRLMMIQIGAFCSLFILALHNGIDFSLEIPAIAITGVIVSALYFGSYRSEIRENASL